MDSILKSGNRIASEYSELAESYVIFITENDVLGKDLSLYHIDLVCYFKESEGGIETMSRVMEEMRDKAVSENNKMCIKEMLNDGLPVEKIARYLHITVKEVEEYAKEVAV